MSFTGGSFIGPQCMAFYISVAIFAISVDIFCDYVNKMLLCNSLYLN